MIDSRIGIEVSQKYLQQLVPQLREEERAKFKAYDINYVPTRVLPATPVTSTNKPKTSKADKAYESMAAMLGVSVEQYKKILEDAKKNVLSIACTCAETPGVCKVHVKE